MKKAVYLILFMINASSIYSQVDLGSIRQGQTARICFFREANNIGAAQKMNVFVNGSYVVGLKNKSSYYYELVAGEQDLSVRSIEEATLVLKAEAGRTYFLRLSTAPGATWSSPPVIERVDSVEACAAIEKMSLKSQSVEPVEYHRTSWCSIGLSEGAGLEDHVFVTTKAQEEITLSAGGGIGLNANCGYQISRRFYILGGLSYYMSPLSAETNEADARFQRLVINMAPGFIIPLGTRERLRFRIGGGVGFYSQVKMLASTASISYYEVIYDTSWGLNASLNFDIRLSSRSGLSAGLKCESVKYRYNKDKTTQYSFPTEFKNPDGSSIYMDFSYLFFF